MTSSQLAAALRDSITRLNRRLRQARPVGDLTITQLSALTSLELSGALTPRELADAERVQPPTLTKIVAKLEERGLVRRSPHPTDGRQVILAASESGREVIAEHRRARDEWLAGQLADRFDKRRILLVANSGSAVVAAFLGVIVLTGVVNLWWVFVTAALFGTISAIETPVRQSFVSELVSPEFLPNALSLSSATFNVARVVGPAVAGLAIALLDNRTGPIFLLTAVLCVAPLVGLARMRTAELFRTEGPPVAASDARTIDGLRYVKARPDLSLTILLVLVVGLFGFNFQLTLAVLAKVEFKVDAQYFGLLTTALAVGALAGALASSRRRERPSAYLVLTAAVLFGGFETLVGFAPTFVTAVLLLLPTGFFMIYFAQAANQRVQLGTDPEFRGRVMALYVLVFLGTTPIGAVIIGWCAEQFGPRSGIWVGGLVSLAATLLLAALQLRKTGGKVRVHLRPSPHVHVFEPAKAGTPALSLRVPAAR